MIFALLAREYYKENSKPSWRFFAFASAWLVFFPNAPYIFTDIVHLTDFYNHFWTDLMLILINALTGLIIGFVSLYLMQSAVRRIAGEKVGWLFVVGVALLSGFGVSLGRFLRLNSWDIVALGKMFHHIGTWSTQPSAYAHPLSFSLLVAAFILIAYLMLYALTYLPPQRASSATQPTSVSPIQKS